MLTQQPTFKRNQLDEALYALFSGPPRSARQRLGQPVPSVFRTRIKRLLELDRALAPADGSIFAFHDGRAPGKGHDVTYTDYRAFNVAIALELVRFGCKQREVVEKIIELETKFRQAFQIVSETYQTLGRTSETSDLSVTLPTRGHRSGGVILDRQIYLIVSQVERFVPGASQADPARLIEVEIARGLTDLQGRLDRLMPRTSFGAFVLEVSEFGARLTELRTALPASRRGR